MAQKQIITTDREFLLGHYFNRGETFFYKEFTGGHYQTTVPFDCTITQVFDETEEFNGDIHYIYEIEEDAPDYGVTTVDNSGSCENCGKLFDVREEYTVLVYDRGTYLEYMGLCFPCKKKYKSYGLVNG